MSPKPQAGVAPDDWRPTLSDYQHAVTHFKYETLKTVSEMVGAVTYDSINKVLYTMFPNESIYAYYGVEAREVQILKDEETSLGKTFNAVIKAVKPCYGPLK